MANSGSNSNQKMYSQSVFSPTSNRDPMKRCSNNNNDNNNDNRNCNHDRRIHIPEDMTLEILLRLPVKSLIRFKCVCKSWLSLVSNPHFAKSHFNRALTPSPSHRLLYKPLNPACKACYSIDIDSSLRHHYIIALPNIMSNHDLSKIRFRGSCRGFVLLDDYPSQTLYLWNPTTGSHKTIPYSPIIAPDPDTWQASLGYDLMTDDYFVLMMSFITCCRSMLKFCVGIFSVRTNSWEEFLGHHEPYGASLAQSVRGLFFNGFIHWLLLNYRVILCFDLRLKKFSKMDPPNSLWLLGAHLMVLQGCLAVCSHYEIWVMKEYKVHSSWTKYSDLCNYEDSVVHINKAGEMIGLRDQSSERGITVVKLDGKGKELESREFGDPSFEVREAFYMESLLSLPEKQNASKNVFNQLQ